MEFSTKFGILPLKAGHIFGCFGSVLAFLLPLPVQAQPSPNEPLSIGQVEQVHQSGQIEQLVREYAADADSIRHRYRIPLDGDATRIRQQLTRDWLKTIDGIDFESLSRSDKIDYLLLKNKLEYLNTKQEMDTDRDMQAADQFLPFYGALVSFCKNREDGVQTPADQLAGHLNQTAIDMANTEKQLDPLQPWSTEQRLSALRAAEILKAMRGSVIEADGYYQGYDPMYNWWCRKPAESLKAAIDTYLVFLQERVVGVPESDTETIIGLPIGAEGIALELKHEWIVHSPDELIALAEREMVWCDEQIRAAAREMGCGDDWRKALEMVKGNFVQPGDQPQLIRDLANEAIQFLRDRDLLTIPVLAANGWRMTMMSPERQRVSPYFLGGNTIIVSFPTDSMTHEEKLMSMRSNNEHFARATVHHELIPGHAMQYFMLARHKPYRALFATAFWMEGWALHWEMLLWDLGFARGPEDRVGMLFWRRHRCARIIFSLNYHLGNMTPQQCIDYLVEQVGHERSAASAEVRRSIMGNYGPMYQAAYMLGGLQLRRMHSELVQSGRMTDREFHDAVLKEHSIPLEVLRDYLSGSPLTKDASPRWRFADPQ